MGTNPNFLIELPLWLSSNRGMPGFSKFSSEKALESGLQIRPLKETIASTLEWDNERGLPPLKAGLDRENEAKLLSILS